VQSFLTVLENFKENYLAWVSVLNITVSKTDIVEMLIIAFLFYHVLKWIKDTRAWMLLKGILVILAFVLVAAIFQMNTILWIAEKTINVAIIAIVVIFQPELRKNWDERNLFHPSFLLILGKTEWNVSMTIRLENW